MQNCIFSDLDGILYLDYISHSCKYSDRLNLVFCSKPCDRVAIAPTYDIMLMKNQIQYERLYVYLSYII